MIVVFPDHTHLLFLNNNSIACLSDWLNSVQSQSYSNTSKVIRLEKFILPPCLFHKGQVVAFMTEESIKFNRHMNNWSALNMNQNY